MELRSGVLKHGNGAYMEHSSNWFLDFPVRCVWLPEDDKEFNMFFLDNNNMYSSNYRSNIGDRPGIWEGQYILCSRINDSYYQFNGLDMGLSPFM